MKKLALLAAVAMVAIGTTSAANATQECTTAALRCFWDFHGNYLVKNYTDSNEYVNPSVYKGDNCVDALELLQSSYDFELETSAGNALTDTHILVQNNCDVD
jgi:hypothetical protein